MENKTRLINQSHYPHGFLKQFNKLADRVLSGIKRSASPRALYPDKTLLLVY